MNDKYIGLSRACAILDRSRASIYRLVKAGSLKPYYRVNKPREILFREDEVLSLTVPKTPDPDRSL